MSGLNSGPYAGHTGPVWSVAYAPGGTTLATAGDDRTARIWDARTGEQLRQLDGHTDWVRSVAYAPDGLTLATAGDDRTARIWDARTGEQLRQLDGHAGTVYSVAYAPDGTTLATAGSDRTARIWDARTGEQLRQLDGHAGTVNSVAYAPDGTTLATAGDDRTARIWDARTGEQLRQLDGHTGTVNSVAYAPDGTTLATAGDDRTARIWDARTGEQLRQLDGHTDWVRSVAYAPDGTTLATAGSDRTARIWDARTGEQLRQLDGHTDWVRSVAYAPDGLTLATAGDDGTARIWDARTGEQLRQLDGHAGLVLAVAYTPDGTTLATAGDDRTARIWDARTGEQLRQLDGHTGTVNSVAYAPDGTTLATAGDDRTARIWDARTGEQLRQLDGHTGTVNSVAYAPDGTTLATAGDDRTARIWDARTGEQLRQLDGHTDWVRSVAYAPDGTTLATAGDDRTARIWDARTGEQLRQLDGHTDWVRSVAYAPDGTTLATAGSDRTARIWDARTGEQLRQLDGHTGTVNSVAYAPDGTTLATAGDDRTARIWDARTGEQLRQLDGHTDWVRSVAYAPDGTTLATASSDSTIRIWDARTGAQIDGTGFGVMRKAGRPLAGVASDAPSERDLIGAAADAETLADLIAAAATSPPLAVALIGDWGAGKSSVMLQIQSRIATLASLSRNNPGLSVFAANVRQVRFNAWDYSDDRLWSGLVEHLFRVLAEDPDEATPPDPASIEAERHRLQREIREQEATQERLSGLQVADRAAPRTGFLAWLSSPVNAWLILTVSVRALAGELRRDWRVLLAWAVLAAAAATVWAFWGTVIGAVVTAVWAAAGPLRAAGKRLLNWHRSGATAIGWLRQRLDQQQHDVSTGIAALKEQLALVDARVRLSAFLAGRAAPGAYQQYRGLLGQVRSDLATLSDDLKAARGEWAASGALTPPPLERIVLYIDDLDRCPPQRVVQVLEAVHLMLALDLFVVVVAVDARWLIASLKYHYRELFSSADAEAPGGPVDYLDKIFQIPYALARPTESAMASYLLSLLPPAAAAPPAAGQAAPAGQPGDTPEPPGPPDRPLDSAKAIPGELSEPDLRATEPPRDASKDDPRQRSQGSGSAIPDLRPLGLQLTQPEIEFMARLAPLLPTPRAAKKLVNLYRLVRIGIPDAELSAFTGPEARGQYQVVQILLAILVGNPAAAHRIFTELMAAPPESDIIAVLAKAAASGSPGTGPCAQIHAELARIARETPLLTDTIEYQRWCPAMARYSFHTRAMAAGDRPGADPGLTPADRTT